MQDLIPINFLIEHTYFFDQPLILDLKGDIGLTFD